MYGRYLYNNSLIYASYTNRLLETVNFVLFKYYLHTNLHHENAAKTLIIDAVQTDEHVGPCDLRPWETMLSSR